MAVYRAINSAIFTRSSISVGALQRLLQKCYLIIALDDAAPQSATLSRSYSRSSRETLPAHRDLVSDFDSSGPASGIKCLWQTKGGGDETLENFGNSDGRVVLQPLASTDRVARSGRALTLRVTCGVSSSTPRRVPSRSRVGPVQPPPVEPPMSSPRSGGQDDRRGDGAGGWLSRRQRAYPTGKFRPHPTTPSPIPDFVPTCTPELVVRWTQNPDLGTVLGFGPGIGPSPRGVPARRHI